MAESEWQPVVEGCYNLLKTNEKTELYFSNLQKLANAIKQNNLKLHQFVELLGPYLSDVSEVGNRLIGAQILADLLHNLPKSFLNNNEVSFLSSFFSDRLQDNVSILPNIIHGLLALSSFDNLSPESSKIIIKTIFQEVQVQSRIQSERMAILTLFNNLLLKDLADLQTLGTEFVMGYIQSIDGERDPRNLVVIFKTLPIIIYNFSLGPFVEELFEVISCYFPIDFTTSQNDPFGISREILAENLKICLGSTPKFSEFAIPLFLEKLDSNLLYAKKDSLQAMAYCAERYGNENLKSFHSSIWNAIRREVLTGLNDEIEAASLECLTTIVHCTSLAVNEPDSKSIMDSFIDEILTECKHILTDPELKLTQSCAKILKSVALASDAASHKIMSAVIPILLQQFTLLKQANYRLKILEIMNIFIELGKTFTEDGYNPLLVHRSSYLSLYFSLLNDTNFELCLATLQGLTSAVKINSLLTAEDFSLLIKHLLQLLFNHEQTEVRECCINAIEVVAIHNQKIIIDAVFPLVKVEIMSDERNNPPSEGTRISRYKESLKVISKISKSQQILDLTIPLMVNHLKALSESTSVNVENVIEIVICLQNIVMSCLENPHLRCYLCTELLLPLIKLIIVATTKESSLVDDIVIHKLAIIFQLVSQALSPSEAKEFLEKFIPAIFSHNLPENVKSCEQEILGQQIKLIHLLTSVICSLQQEVPIPFLLILLDLLWKAAFGNFPSPVNQRATEAYASLINKIPADSEWEIRLMNSRNTLEAQIVTDSMEDDYHKPLNLWIWMTKALVYRGHNEMEIFIDKLIKFMEDPRIGKLAADGINVILDNNSQLMTNETHANIRIMYHQRFYLSTVKKLITGFQNSNSECESNFLVAIIHQLKYLPQQVLQDELEILMPLLIKSLLLENKDVLISSLNTFQKLLSSFADLFVFSISRIIPSLLKLTHYPESMTVRILALQCINSFSQLPPNQILPFQDDVISGLAQTLDDSKRLVRKEAVLARGNWYCIRFILS